MHVEVDETVIWRREFEGTSLTADHECGDGWSKSTDENIPSFYPEYYRCFADIDVEINHSAENLLLTVASDVQGTGAMYFGKVNIWQDGEKFIQRYLTYLRLIYFCVVSKMKRLQNQMTSGFLREFSSESHRILILGQLLGIFSVGNSGLTFFQHFKTEI